MKMIPYGEDCPVTKNECVGHVQTRLRNNKKADKLGGKNRLTEAIIKKLTLYCGLAIRRNVDSVEGMKKVIIVTLDHNCSTDKSPRHENCPTGADSWCEWRKAEAANQLKTFKHPPRVIDEQIEKHIRPIYQDLSNDDLITRSGWSHAKCERVVQLDSLAHGSDAPAFWLKNRWNCLLSGCRHV